MLNGISRLSGTEKVFVNVMKTDVEKMRRLARAKHKSVCEMQNITDKPFRSGELVDDLFFGTFWSSKAYLELS